MILQDHTPAIPQGFGDPLAFFGGDHGPAVARVHGEVVVEAEGVLVDHLDGTAETTKGFAVDRVRVAGGVEVRACFVDGTVDCEGWAVYGGLGAAGLDFAVLVDEDEV